MTQGYIVVVSGPTLRSSPLGLGPRIEKVFGSAAGALAIDDSVETIDKQVAIHGGAVPHLPIRSIHGFTTVPYSDNVWRYLDSDNVWRYHHSDNAWRAHSPTTMGGSTALVCSEVGDKPSL